MKNGGRPKDRRHADRIGQYMEIARPAGLSQRTSAYALRPVLNDANYRRLIIGNFTTRQQNLLFSVKYGHGDVTYRGYNITLRGDYRADRAPRARVHTVAPVYVTRKQRFT